MTSQTNIRNVVRIADGIETNDPRSWRNIETARRLRQLLICYAPQREVAAEILRQRRATRRANNQARG